LFAGAYMGGGWLGVFLVAGVLGAGVAGASRMALRFGGSSLCYIYSLTLIPIALRIDEAWAGPSIAMLISSLVYPSILFLSAVLIERALPRRQAGCNR